ncbi:glycerophosphodiester phosphodiesterase family protein [Sphingobacterium sp. Mn56C]|uniref:glycerophosphodiester phosphodiesterase family protein n=1 Tax=Sphingobacterium sp. Mn56C TaxID=3395261 RepID=UPI003BC8E136
MHKTHWYTTLLLSLLLLFTGCVERSGTGNSNTTASTTSNVLFNSSVFNLKTVDDLQRFLTYNEQSYPLVSVHRGGGMEKYPENAIESFAYFAAKMPVIIECDVRLSKDSVMLLMHDETLERTTNGRGKISHKTWQQLKALKLKDAQGRLTNYTIPSLEEALTWGNGKVIYTLDVKPDVPYKMLSDLIIRLNAQPYTVVITYSAQQAKALHTVNPDLMLSVSIKNKKDMLRLIAMDIPDTKMLAFVGTAVPTPDLVESLHQHGIKIILGTLGNLDNQAEKYGYQRYAEFIERGADILSTDHPLQAQKALDFYIQKRKLTSPYIN